MYEDWQLLRIRRALRAYHRYHLYLKEEPYIRVKDGEGYREVPNWDDPSWQRVADAIYEHTEVTINQERLRQFVKGLDGKDGVTRYPVPKAASMAAIVSFLVHPDNNLLSVDELERYEPKQQAPVRLLEYLQDGEDVNRLIPTGTLKGVFRCLTASWDEFYVRELALENPSEEGFLKAVEIEEVFSSRKAYMKRNPLIQDDQLKQRKVFDGWAIYTPEDSLFVFLKDTINGRNKYYMAVGIDSAIWSDSEIRRVYFFPHVFPELVSDTGDHLKRRISELKKELSGSILPYTRTGNDVDVSDKEEYIHE